jgi:hypothetical protein
MDPHPAKIGPGLQRHTEFYTAGGADYHALFPDGIFLLSIEKDVPVKTGDDPLPRTKPLQKGGRQYRTEKNNDPAFGGCIS